MGGGVAGIATTPPMTLFFLLIPSIHNAEPFLRWDVSSFCLLVIPSILVHIAVPKVDAYGRGVPSLPVRTRHEIFQLNRNVGYIASALELSIQG